MGLLASSFSFSFANVSSPAASASSPIDSATLANVRFTYTGTTNNVVAGQTTTLSFTTALSLGNSNLGTFTVYSPYGQVSGNGSYDGQNYRGVDNTIQGNIGFVAVPVNPTPEPSALAALGLGRRRKRAVLS